MLVDSSVDLLSHRTVHPDRMTARVEVVKLVVGMSQFLLLLMIGVRPMLLLPAAGGVGAAACPYRNYAVTFLVSDLYYTLGQFNLLH